MYQFQLEFQRKERIFKAYIFLFIITALVNVFLFLVDNNSSYPILRGSISLLFFCTILYFGLRRKIWAVLIIKSFVWVHLLLLIIISLSFIFI
ncbi:hypothetical protein P4534_04210 [Peribacillus butanolivorans]|uniref:hypothetical protein n=1 Tax=Peribacillus butanolivorans TaxID=421767 RepID=UPI002E1D3D9F|nr:hypothetical protein [Peribacillus butanolivorans]